MNFHSISHDHLLSLFHFALRSSYALRYLCRVHFHLIRKTLAFSETAFLAPTHRLPLNFRTDERSATIADSTRYRSVRSKESFYAGSALIRRRSDVRRVGTLRASCLADRTRLLGNERTTSSKTRLFENQISPRRPDRREISKIVRGSFDRACENNAAIGNERRYRRRYR